MVNGNTVCFRFLELVKLHPGVHRVELEVEGGGLGGLLLVAGQTHEAVGDGVGDAEVHGSL